MFLAYRMHPDQVRAVVEDYGEAMQSLCDELEATIDKLDATANPPARAGRLSALHGLRTAQARLAWADEVENQFGDDLE
jgi:hypothetical protein